ncbi:MAG: ATPase, T2SS/T4P/T4SS family, partial [Verrucomicrobiota bacterium]
MPLARIQASIVNHLSDLDRLTEEQARNIVTMDQELSGDEVEKLLMKDYEISEFQLLVAKSRAFGLAPYNAHSFRPDERSFERLDREFCQQNKILPVGLVGNFIIVALANPFDLSVTNKVQEMTRKKVMVLLALERDIMHGLKDDDVQEIPVAEGFGDVVEALDLEFSVDENELDDDEDAEESAPIIQLANRIIEDAYYSGASDIHIEPSEKDCRVRMRVDGVLTEKLSLPIKVAGSLLARIKVMSNL